MSRRRKKTVLLTIGRLPVALDLARGFHRAGYRVIVAETRYLQLCRMSAAVERSVTVPPLRQGHRKYLDALEAVVRREQVDLVVPVSEETVAVAALAERFEDGPPCFCLSQDRVLQLHDKLAFNRLADGLGLPVPVTRSGSEAAGVDWPPGDIVVKRRFSASGRGLRICPIPELGQVDDSVVVQERLPGEELSGFALARGGRTLASTVYRARVRSGSVAVCFERAIDADDVLAWMEEFISRTGHTGFIGFDFLRDGAGVARAVECNPRATSGLHFLHTEVLPQLIAGGEEAMPEDKLVYRDAESLVEAYSCFTALLGAVGDRDRRRSIARELRAATDVCWSRWDPLPFLLMIVNTWPVIWGAIRSGRSFAEVAVEDIEWRAAYE